MDPPIEHPGQGINDLIDQNQQLRAENEMLRSVLREYHKARMGHDLKRFYRAKVSMQKSAKEAAEGGE